MLTSTYLAALPQQKGPLPIVPMTQLHTLPSVSWLIEGLMQGQGLVILYGEAGHAKSFFAIDFALSIASGQSWRGRKVLQGPVVYIAGEGAYGMKHRVEAWRAANPDANIDQAYLIPVPVMFHEPSEVDRLMADVGKLPAAPVLIVIDTLAQNAVGVEENSVKEIGQWIHGAHRLQDRFKCSVLILHHSAKGSEKERGSTALRGAADTMIRVHKDTFGEIEMSCAKQKEAEEFKPESFRLEKVPGTTSAVLTASGPGVRAMKAATDAFTSRLKDLVQTHGVTDAATVLLVEFPEAFAHSTNPIEAAKGRVKRGRVQARKDGVAVPD